VKYKDGDRCTFLDKAAGAVPYQRQNRVCHVINNNVNRREGVVNVNTDFYTFPPTVSLRGRGGSKVVHLNALEQSRVRIPPPRPRQILSIHRLLPTCMG
jgi:hypothetical protein